MSLGIEILEDRWVLVPVLPAGTAVNAVKDVERVLVTAGTGVPTSALILGVD